VADAEATDGAPVICGATVVASRERKMERRGAIEGAVKGFGFLLKTGRGVETLPHTDHERGRRFRP
jgi:hypothetical protein